MSNDEKIREEEHQHIRDQRAFQQMAQCMMDCVSCISGSGCPYFSFYTEPEPMKHNRESYADEPEHRLSKSLEDYLEVIFVIGKVNGNVRSVDVAEFMHYSKASVSHAVKLLKKGNYLTDNRDSFLYLTDSGKRIAGRIYERHRVITSFLVNIGVEEKIAEQDACKIEHIISEESFRSLKAFFKEYLKNNLCWEN